MGILQQSKGGSYSLYLSKTFIEGINWKRGDYITLHLVKDGGVLLRNISLIQRKVKKLQPVLDEELPIVKDYEGLRNYKQ